MIVFLVSTWPNHPGYRTGKRVVVVVQSVYSTETDELSCTVCSVYDGDC